MMYEEQLSLKPYNTLFIDIIAPYFVRVHTLNSLISTLSCAREQSSPVLILGKGSNVVLHSLPSNTIVCLMQLMGKAIIGNTKTHTHVRAYAGESWNEWVTWLIAHGIYGCENLYGIPGTVGAAPIQNCGAYGVELSNYLERIHYWDCHQQKLCNISAIDCQFGYRQSIFKQHPEWIILSIDCAFPTAWTPQIDYADLAYLKKQHRVTPQEIMMAIKHIRHNKFPAMNSYGTVGSFFVNPVIPSTHYADLKKHIPDLKGQAISATHYKIPAAQLIEQAQWKGKRRDHVGIYEKHALILVTYGPSSGQDILDFAEAIRQDVLTRFAVDLAIEPTVYRNHHPSRLITHTPLP